MPDADNLSPGWSQRLDGTPDTRSGVTFEYQTATDTKFHVTITPQPEHSGYTLHLSPNTPQATQPEHEYHVRTYDRRKHALDGAHTLMDELTRRIARGELSTTEPDIDERNDVIESISTESDRSLSDWLRTLLR